MQRINTNNSAVTILNRFSAYTLARLRGNPNLAEVADVAQRAHDSLHQAIDADWSAQQSTMAALSVRDEKQYQLDVALREMRHAILAAVRNNRRSTLYKTAFPDGFTDVLRRNPNDELEQARSILQKLAEVQSTGIPPAVQVLQAAADDLAAAIAACEAAETAEKGASVALGVEKEQFAASYQAVYCSLVTTLDDWRLAETYFRHVPPRGGKQAKEDPQPQPVPQPEPQPEPVPARAPAPAALTVVSAPAGVINTPVTALAAGPPVPAPEPETVATPEVVADAA